MQVAPRYFDKYVETHLSTDQKLMLTLGALLCYAAWYFLLSSANLPYERRVSASLLVQQTQYGLVLVAVAIPLLSLAASLVVGRIRFEAGLFVALIGLVVLPSRSGDIRNVLLDAGSPSVYLKLAMESVVLWASIAAAYWLMSRVCHTRFLASPAIALDKDPDTLADRLTVVAAQAACTLILLILIGQSPLKGQALAAACAAGLLSSMAIHQMYAVSGAIWYISGTMLAGVVAYVLCYFSPDGYQIGDIRSMVGGAARSLPLHYASLGAAGAIMGYWSSLVWRAARKTAAAETQSA